MSGRMATGRSSGSRGLLPDEARLIFLTAGPADVDAQLVERLRAPLVWEQVLIIAEWERSLPFSWRRLRALGAKPEPEVATALDRVSQVSEFRGMMLQDQFTSLMQVCADAAIPVILLKGAGLALTSYSTFNERPMGDIDLLVAPGDEERLWQVAMSHGWTWDAEAFPRAKYSGHHHLPPLFDQRRTGAKLEIHTALNLHGHPFSFSFDQARAHSQRVAHLPGDAMVLEPAYMIVHLAVHFAWAHLASFGLWRLARDFRALASRGVDWDEVARVSATYKASAAVYWSYRLVDMLAGGHDAPGPFLGSLRRRRGAVWERLLERHLEGHVVSRIVPCPSEWWRRRVWSMALDPEQVGTARPWDEDPLILERVLERRGGLSRLSGQLTHLAEWWRYLSGLRSV